MNEIYCTSSVGNYTTTQHNITCKVPPCRHLIGDEHLGHSGKRSVDGDEVESPFLSPVTTHPPSPRTPNPNLRPPQPVPLCSPSSQKSCDEMRRSSRTYCSILCFVAGLRLLKALICRFHLSEPAGRWWYCSFVCRACSFASDQRCQSDNKPTAGIF